MYPYLYSLEKYRGAISRFVCPACNKIKAFTRYVNITSGEYLNPEVGRCNRESKCGYHFHPRSFFLKKGLPFTNSTTNTKTPLESLKPPPISYIPREIAYQSMASYQKNNFILYLFKLLGNQVKNLINEYKIGTSHYWPGAVVFWQLDQAYQIRTGKVMLYDPETGKRIREPQDHFHWAHKLLPTTNYCLKQCFFGEHLLARYPNKKVAIVESEKSAIIASAFYPDYVWLGCGGLSNLSHAKCQVLKGRAVLLVPDLGGYEKWQIKAATFRGLISNEISSALEQIATPQERAAGLDIADFLMANRVREIRF